MLKRNPIFPNVIELNYQLGRIIGCNVYLVYNGDQWLLIDIGYEDVVDDVIETIRQMDFPFSNCVGLIATHADVDHIQGLAKLKGILKAPVLAHELAATPLKTGDPILTFAKIDAQGIDLKMPPVDVDQTIDDGESISIGGLDMDVWLTPGHTDSQLSFRLGNLLFCGDNIYRDGCVGAIDAHHGSDIPAFIKSLTRIRESDVEWLLPSHGPVFRKDNQLLDATIKRLNGYLHMADFGTCATDWPLMDAWEEELNQGKMPH
ncbi:MBL fold metallo-hydrolase [Pirellulaceae bacterium]|nr:MBL fold metallo-hydrolase [Pirellulaceae bacterium]